MIKGGHAANALPQQAQATVNCRILPGVSNIGRNPTVGEVEARLETHLFDFDEDIYGEVIETFLIAFLRPEEKFDGLAPLIEQMACDCIEARRILGVGSAI
jgi:riboflavin kinase/FMN adenylyltransferase